MFAALASVLVLAGCSGNRTNDPWLPASTVPDRPAQEYRLAERQDIRSDLTYAGQVTDYKAAALRYQTGLAANPPPALPPEPPRGPGAPVVQPPPAPPNVTAAYLKQQIETELYDNDLAQFLVRLPDTPIDVDAALAAGTLRPLRTDLERVTLKRFQPTELEPVYPAQRFAWLTKRPGEPPINQVLDVFGITRQPRLAATLQTPQEAAIDKELGRSRLNAPTQNQNTSEPTPNPTPLTP